MNVNPLTVGPIVGATTGTSVRIWGRGKGEATSSGIRRCFGIARLRLGGTSEFGPSKFFKMNPNFDMTGIVIFSALSAEQLYEYQIGWFFADLELSALSPDMAFDWSELETVPFTTAAEDKSRSRSFIFGSCRYLLRLFGGSWFDNRGDKVFRSILNQIDKDGKRTDQVLMLGDQIYADDLNIIAPDSTIDDYNSRYQDAFSQPYIRKLMSRVPTYMTLDDHEIEDNWPSNSTPRDLVTKYPAAIHAYQSYQLSHSPLFGVSGDKIYGVPQKFWYTYHDGCCDFFVMDARTERVLGENAPERAMISEEQMTALKEWLVDDSSRVKFIASSVPFFPDSKQDGDDKWAGFPTQRSEILEFIRQNKVKRVVFLSGDIHASMSADLVSPQEPDFKVISVISSPFFWPYPQITRRAFILSGSLPLETPIEYEVVNAGPVHGEDNFTRVEVDLNGLQVEVFSRKGKLLGTKNHSF